MSQEYIYSRCNHCGSSFKSSQIIRLSKSDLSKLNDLQTQNKKINLGVARFCLSVFILILLACLCLFITFILPIFAKLVEPTQLLSCTDSFQRAIEASALFLLTTLLFGGGWYLAQIISNLHFGENSEQAAILQEMDNILIDNGLEPNQPYVLKEKNDD